MNPTKTDLQRLKDIAQRLTDACPDMREEARGIAQDLIKKHTGKDLEPDDVWWHLFDSTASNPRSFTGWEHITPTLSLTFPQLVLHRFGSQFQEDPTALQQYSGFYRAGPQAPRFNETNEVRILPQDVLNDFWAIDFRWRYGRKLDRFWSEHADDFRALAKARYLASALEDRQARRISDDHFQTLVRAVAGNVTWPIDLAQLRAESPAVPGLDVYAFDIGGILSSDILRIVDSNGRQYLYVPGEINAFHVFETPYDLLWWVLGETNMASNRARFMAHFLASDQQQSDATGLNHLLDLLVYNLGANHSKAVNKYNIPISEDPFTFLRDAARGRMYEDAEFLLPSNGDYRKIMWIGYLAAASQVFGAIAALDWPVALALVGAGIASTGLNIDQAMNGRTTAQRKAGVLGAIFSAIDTLFNGLMLWAPGAALVREFKPLQVGVAAAELEAALPEPLRPATAPELLAAMETNDILDAVPTGGVGKMRGIHVTERGETLIQIDGLAYSVRYVQELKTWVIIDPANPYSFYRNVPVRLNAEGNWQPLGSGGLKGGGRIFGKKPWGRATTSAAPDQGPRTPTFSYDIPPEIRPSLQKAADGLDDNSIRGYMSRPLAVGETDSFQVMRGLRDKLNLASNELLTDATLPPRPEIPELDPTLKEKYFLKDLLETAPGLIVGESHSSIGSKKLLIENMEVLARQNVRTLYMEHLLTDFHQADLDTYARTGEMPWNLKQYLEGLDQGFRTDPGQQYTFKELVRTANQHHIRVQAIDCMASYRLAGLDDTTGNVRQKMMNYFARSVIDSTQRLRDGGKWVALMGNTHVNPFKGIPGVADLEGAIGLRVEDVPSGQGQGLRPDPGLKVQGDVLQAGGEVKSDLLYQMETLSDHAITLGLEQKLNRPGLFAVDHSTQPSQIIHRSSDNTLGFTPIRKDGAFIYITDRPRWIYVNNRRFDSLRELVSALKLTGMREVL